MASDPAIGVILVFAGSVGSVIALVAVFLFVFGNRRK